MRNNQRCPTLIQAIELIESAIVPLLEQYRLLLGIRLRDSIIRDMEAHVAAALEGDIEAVRDLSADLFGVSFVMESFDLDLYHRFDELSKELERLSGKQQQLAA